MNNRWTAILEEVKSGYRWFNTEDVRSAAHFVLASLSELEQSNSILKQNTITEQNEELNNLRREVREARDADYQLKVKINENTALHAELKARFAEIEKLKTANANLVQQVNRDRELKDELDAANMDCIKLHEENKKLRQELDSNTQNHLKYTEDLCVRISEVEQNYKSLWDHLNGISDKLGSVLREVKTYPKC